MYSIIIIIIIIIIGFQILQLRSIDSCLVGVAARVESCRTDSYKAAVSAFDLICCTNSVNCEFLSEEKQNE